MCHLNIQRETESINQLPFTCQKNLHSPTKPLKHPYSHLTASLSLLKSHRYQEQNCIKIIG